MLSGRVLFFTSEYQDLGYREAVASPWNATIVTWDWPPRRQLPERLPAMKWIEAVPWFGDTIWRWDDLGRLGWPGIQENDADMAIILQNSFLFHQALPEKQIRSELRILHMTHRLYRKFITVNCDKDNYDPTYLWYLAVESRLSNVISDFNPDVSVSLSTDLARCIRWSICPTKMAEVVSARHRGSEVATASHLTWFMTWTTIPESISHQPFASARASRQQNAIGLEWRLPILLPWGCSRDSPWRQGHLRECDQICFSNPCAEKIWKSKEYPLIVLQS